MTKRVLFTMDIDWTSEDVIQSALSFFIERNIPCLLFQTHLSQVIVNDKSGLFSHELHPNFCENSEHGKHIDDIFKTINAIDHLGISIRAHKYYMPDEVLKKISTDGYKFTLNNYTNLSYIKPIKINQTIIELNTFFEDGFYLKYKYPFDVNFVIDRMQNEGIYVFNIHPIHLTFNANVYALTRNFKDTMSRVQYRNIDNNFIRQNINKDYGIRTFLEELIHEFRLRGYGFININEVDI